MLLFPFLGLLDPRQFVLVSPDRRASTGSKTNATDAVAFFISVFYPRYNVSDLLELGAGRVEIADRFQYPLIIDERFVERRYRLYRRRAIAAFRRENRRHRDTEIQLVERGDTAVSLRDPALADIVTLVADGSAVLLPQVKNLRDSLLLGAATGEDCNLTFAAVAEADTRQYTCIPTCTNLSNTYTP